MWIVVMGVIWAIRIFLLLAFIRGASAANECYDDGHEAAVLRTLKSNSTIHKAA
jgi:hypothetical protein